jgi:hypothetical protein
MGVSGNDHLCAMGERCTQHETLGQPSKLSRHNHEPICEACRREGYSREDMPPASGVHAADKDQPARREGASETLKSSGPPQEEVAMSVKVYEREGWPLEAWRRLCEQHGEDPASEVVYVWEGSEPGETLPPDMMASCGKLGVAISGYSPICEECWSEIRAGEPPRVCEPWDDVPTQLEERYSRLLRAARTLFDAGVRTEEEIVPTPVWAAKSWELGLLERITNCLADAGEGSDEWYKLKERFAGVLGAFEPVRVMDGVLVLHWVPIAVVGIPNEETGAIETITIDVRRRSVKPQDVGRIYSRYLQHKGIAHNSSQGSVGSVPFNGVLRLSVRPEEPWAYPMGLAPLRVRGGQLPFPAPRIVESNFRELKGSKARGEGFGFTLSGREKGQGPMHNAIPAVCAWYLGGRGKLISQPSLRPDVAHILNRRLLKPCGKKMLVEGTWTPADTLWSTIKVVDPSILRAEHELRQAYLALSFLF